MGKKEEDKKYEKLTDEQLEEIMRIKSGQFSEESGKEAERIRKELERRKKEK